jgi:transcriptional regulator with XRE-family HTH domain
VNAAELVELSTVRVLARSGAARSIRLAAGLSLPQVAVAVGVKSPTTVWRWEEGLRAPSGKPALAYKRLLDELQRSFGSRTRRSGPREAVRA